MNAARSGRGAFRGRLLTIGTALLVVGLGGLIGYLVWRQSWAWRHYHEAQAALGRHDPAAAADHLARCLEVWPHDRATLLLAARTARRADRLPEAQRLQDVYRTRHGTSPELALEQVLLEAQSGQLQNQEPFLVAVVAENHPDTPLILEALTLGYVKTFRVRDAFTSADALLRRQPDHAQAWVWRGWAQENLNRNEEALDDYRQAVALQPEYAWARLCLGVLLLDRFKRYAEALEQFRWLRQRQPHDADIGLGTVRCLRGIGDVEQARSLLDELTAALPTEGLILSERGQLALEEGQPDEAERWLRRAVALAPFDRQTNFTLSQCLQQLGHPEEAEQLFRRYQQILADGTRLKALERELSKPDAAAERRGEAGVLCLRLGREADGERYLLSALQADPNYLPAHRALAEYYEKSGRHGLAAFHRAAASP